MYEIESNEELVETIKDKGNLCQMAVQGLDLRSETKRLKSVSAKGAVFLGCRLEEAATAHITASGGIVVPELGPRPYGPFRPRLYTVDELMDGYVRGDHKSFYTETYDSRIYRHYSQFRGSVRPVPIDEALSQRIHDHAIDDALYDLLYNNGEPLSVVAIMGGHKMSRSDGAFSTMARVARSLTRKGHFIASGGGPGAMEAANLGAYFAAYDVSDLEASITMLDRAQHYDVEGYFDCAYEVLDRYPEGAQSLAIPTWFYGHEPANLFASHIAKYFANSIREDGLLAIATHGVIYAPGSAGTIQEVFMDAAQNHYVTFGQISPMVFFDEDYWTREKPVYPLLKQLADSKPYGRMLTITDDEAEVVAFIQENPPTS